MGVHAMSEVILDPVRWESMEAGDTAFIEDWTACEGDRVHAGQVIGRAVLARQNVDIEAPHDGVLEQICVARGDSFGHGDVLARIVNF
jgi:biotin carboxyl carrier protein